MALDLSRGTTFSRVKARREKRLKREREAEADRQSNFISPNQGNVIAGITIPATINSEEELNRILNQILQNTAADPDALSKALKDLPKAVLDPDLQDQIRVLTESVSDVEFAGALTPEFINGLANRLGQVGDLKGNIAEIRNLAEASVTKFGQKQVAAQKLEQGRAVDDVTQQGEQAGASAFSRLARQGGIGSGAAERIAQNTAEQAALNRNRVRGAGAQQRGNILAADAGFQQGLITRTLPGLQEKEIANQRQRQLDIRIDEWKSKMENRRAKDKKAGIAVDVIEAKIRALTDEMEKKFQQEQNDINTQIKVAQDKISRQDENRLDERAGASDQVRGIAKRTALNIAEEKKLADAARVSGSRESGFTNPLETSGDKRALTGSELSQFTGGQKVFDDQAAGNGQITFEAPKGVQPLTKNEFSQFTGG